MVHTPELAPRFFINGIITKEKYIKINIDENKITSEPVPKLGKR
jgi:hypothetical protein